MRRIRTAVVGLSFGSWMIENEILPESSGGPYIEIAAVCDLNEEKASAWGKRLQVPYYTSLEQLLSDITDLEAVALFTGPNGRAELIEQIIRSGKHVMTTKPFEIDSAKAKKVLELARSLGTVVHLNSPSPELTGDMLQIRRWIDRYDLGRPVAFRAETTCSYREQYNGSWYDDPLKCPVAPIFRLGIYLINDCIRFFGEAEQVSVQQSRIFTGRPTPDNAQLGIRFRNGALGSIFASFCIEDRQYYRLSLVMNFERGTIYRNVGPRPEKEGSQLNSLAVVAVKDGVQHIERSEMESHGYQWETFHRTVRGDRADHQSYHDEIVDGIRIIEAMIREQSR